MHGNKDYEFNKKIKIKGIKKDAEKLANGDYLQKHFLTKNSRYKKAIPDGIVRVVDIRKSLKRTYDKGTISGDNSFPFVLHDW